MRVGVRDICPRLSLKVWDIRPPVVLEGETSPFPIDAKLEFCIGCRLGCSARLSVRTHGQPGGGESHTFLIG